MGDLAVYVSRLADDSLPKYCYFYLDVMVSFHAEISKLLI